MASIIEFNGRKYDSLTGKMLVPAHKAEHIEVQRVFKPGAKSIDVVHSPGKKIAIKSDFGEAEPVPPPPKASASTHQGVTRRRKVERPKTLMRTAVKKTEHKPAPEHKPPVRVELYKELRKERARRAKHVLKSSAIAKFSKTTPVKHTEVAFKPEPLPVAIPPLEEIVTEFVSNVSDRTQQFADKLEQAVESAESHLEVLADDKLKTPKSRRLAYAFASATSVFLLAFAVYQAIPFIQVKMAGNKAGFAAALPHYAPNGYGLENNLESDTGVVTLTYRAGEENKKYQITQMPSQWNSDSLLNSYVLPTSAKYERLDQNGQTVYVYNDKSSATWLDGGIWYRLDGANNFSEDQLLRIVQGL